MTGIVGLFNRNGEAADALALRPALLAVQERGPDGQCVHVGGPVALGIARLISLPEDLVDPWRFDFGERDLFIVLDGRLDDRQGLIRLAGGAASGLHSGVPDTAIALRLYLRFGLDFARHLLGDYALALWDGRERRLVCARDPFGLRPFYYSVSAERFVFGSTPRAVLAYAGVSAAPNPGMIGEYLAFAFCSKEETLYREIRRLAPGHTLVVDPARLALRPHWSPESPRRVRYRDDREYAEHLRELFRQAVVDRLRCVGPVGLTLSGGIDSSAVAGMAQSLLDAQGADARLHAYSMTYPGQECDETPFIDAVVEKWGLHSRRFPWTGFAAQPWVEQAAHMRDVPEFPFATRISALYRGARSDGVRVLLTGEGGDFWQCGTSLPHRQMLTGLRFGAMVEELRESGGRYGWRRALALALASLLWGIVPGSLRRGLESRRGPLNRSPFLPRAFVREIDLARRLGCGAGADRYADAVQWQLAKRGLNGLLLHFMEAMERSAASHGVELRHPLWDRRIVEFSLATPDYLRRQGGRERVLFRTAVADLYPEAVRRRTACALFNSVMAQALVLPQVRQVLQSSALLERPWIAADRYLQHMQRTLGACESGAVPGLSDMFVLWMLFAVEAWLRADVA